MKIKIDPHCQRRNYYAEKVLFNDVQIILILTLSTMYGIDYVDIVGRSSTRGDLVTCVLYVKAVMLLPLC